MSMTREQAIQQLESLRAHCDSMFDDKWSEDEVWSRDILAIDIAIAAITVIEDILGDEYDLDRLRELAQADREGRCAVLSTPMRPMICKPNDTDVYCPRCGETLSGGWPESAYDDYRKMVQCPNCGESIDDNKCEPEAALKGVNENGMDKR